MKKMLKIMATILLVYEPLGYMFFVKKNFCEDLFSWRFCSSNMLEIRVLLFLVVPIIISALCVIWAGSLSKIIRRRNNKQKKSEKPQPKIKQQVVSPAESLRNFWTRCVDTEGVSQRSEYWFATIFYWLIFTIVIMGISELFKSFHPDCFWDMFLQNDMMFCSKYVTCMNVIIFFVGLVPTIPQLTLNARRWHDIGLPGFLALLPFVLLGFAAIDLFAVPVLFILIQMGAFCFPSKVLNNPYRKQNKKKVSGRSGKNKAYGWQDWD